MDGNLDSELRNFPEVLGLEPAQAEALLQRLGGQPSAPVFVDAVLSARWLERGARGNAFKFSLVAEGPYFLTAPDDLATPLIQMTAKPKPTEDQILAQKKSGEEPWLLWEDTDQARLMDLAERFDSASRTGVRIFDSPGKFGTMKARAHFYPCEDDPNVICTLVPNPVNFKVYEALGIPASHVIGGWSYRVGAKGKSGTAIILPAPAEAYRMPPDGQLSVMEYSRMQSDAIIDYAVSNVFLVDVPKQNDPVLVLAAEPISGGLVQSSSKDPHTYFDMPRPPISLRSILEPVVETDSKPLPALHMSKMQLRGLHPGMAITDAEQILQTEMKIGWTGQIPQLTMPKPFQESVRAFMSADGLEQIQVIEDSAGEGTIAAIARSIVLSDGTSSDDAKAKLIETFGEPRFRAGPGSLKQLVWSAAPESEWKNDNPCFFKVEQQQSASVRPRMKSVGGEGHAHMMPAHQFTPSIIIGGRTQMNGGKLVSDRVSTPGVFEGCGVALVALAFDVSGGTAIQMALVDLEAYQGNR